MVDSKIKIKTFILDRNGRSVDMEKLTKLPYGYPGHWGSIEIVVNGSILTSGSDNCTIDVLWDQMLRLEEGYLNSGSARLEHIFDWAYDVSFQKISTGLLIRAGKARHKKIGEVASEGDFLTMLNLSAGRYFQKMITLRNDLDQRYKDMLELIQVLNRRILLTRNLLIDHRVWLVWAMI